MDVFLALLGFLFTCLGILGSFIPILPGPITSWIGLLLLQLTTKVPLNWNFLMLTLVIAVLIFFLDYIFPIIGTKRFGGTKNGVYGTTIGLVVGLFSPIPFGILIGAFLGALVGEILYDNTNIKRALKASFGAFLGFLTSIVIKFSVSLIYLVLFVNTFWNYKALFLK